MKSLAMQIATWGHTFNHVNTSTALVRLAWLVMGNGTPVTRVTEASPHPVEGRNRRASGEDAAQSSLPSSSRSAVAQRVAAAHGSEDIRAALLAALGSANELADGLKTSLSTDSGYEELLAALARLRATAETKGEGSGDDDSRRRGAGSDADDDEAAPSGGGAVETGDESLPGFFSPPPLTAADWPQFIDALNTLTTLIRKQLSDVTNRELTNMVWGMAKLGYYDGQLMATLLAKFEESTAGTTPQGCSLLFWSCAVTQHPLTDSFVQALVAKTLSLLDSPAFEPQSLSNIAWAAPRLAVDREAVLELMQAIMAKSVRIQRQFKHSELAMLLHSAATHVPPDLAAPELRSQMLAMTGTVERAIRAGSAPQSREGQERAMLLFAYSYLDIYSPPIVEAFVAVFPSWLTHGLDPKSVFATSWALANVRHFDRDVMQCLAAEYVKLLDQGLLELASQEGSNCLWGLTKLGVELTPGQMAVVRRLMLQSPGMAISSSALLAWCLAMQGALDREMIKVVRASIELHSGAVLDGVTTGTPEMMILLAQLAYTDMYCRVQLGQTGEELADNTRAEVMPSDVAALAYALTRKQVASVSSASVSVFQSQVFATMRQLGANPVMEFITADGVHSVDVAVATRSGIRFAIEADGPSHFTVNEPYVRLKDSGWRHAVLQALGWRPVSVPFYEWMKLTTQEQKNALMKKLLKAALDDDPDAVAG